MTKLKISQTEWNFDLLFKDKSQKGIDENLKETEKACSTFVKKWKARDDYLHKPEVMTEAIRDYEKLCRNYGTDGNAGYYVWLRSAQDQEDPEVKAQFNKVSEKSVKLLNDIQFFPIKIAKIPENEQNQFLEHEGLKEFKHFLERSFAEAKYVLSEPEEKILNIKSQFAHTNWTKMVSELLSKQEREVLDEDGEKKLLSYSQISSLLSSKKKETRDSAAKAINEILEKYAEIAEAEMNSILGNKKATDELRGFTRADQSRHLSDDIDTEVVDALIDSVSGRYDISSRYYELKAKMMGVDKLAYHERNVEYGNVEKKYSFEEGAELVYKVVNDLDSRFGEIFADFLEKGLIDVYPRKGKRDGAFCAGNLISQPTYTLLNHSDKLNDVLTIAHELGHGINNELMKERVNSLNFGTPLATAEVASTFMEDFVLQELLADADDESRLNILMTKLNDDISSITRQVAGYKFELDLHGEFAEKGFVSKEEIGKIFEKNMSAYMGNSVSYDPGSQNWWIYWSHFRSFFYVYSYASGLLISKSLQNSVKQDPKFIENVKEFLSAGTSDSPKNIFAKMNIDIADKTFWDKGMDEVESLLSECESLAKKLGKIK